eukprot:846054_1
MWNQYHREWLQYHNRNNLIHCKERKSYGKTCLDAPYTSAQRMMNHISAIYDEAYGNIWLQNARDLSTSRWRRNFNPLPQQENEERREKNEREFYGKSKGVSLILWCNNCLVRKATSDVISNTSHHKTGSKKTS